MQRVVLGRLRTSRTSAMAPSTKSPSHTSTRSTTSAIMHIAMRARRSATRTNRRRLSTSSANGALNVVVVNSDNFARSATNCTTPLRATRHLFRSCCLVFHFSVVDCVLFFLSLSLIFASCGLKEWDRDCTARSKCKVNARRRRRGSLLAVSLVAVISLCCSMNSIPAKYRLFFRLLFDLMFRFRFFFFSEITNWISSLLCIMLFRFVHVALLSWSIRRYYTIYISCVVSLFSKRERCFCFC